MNESTKYLKIATFIIIGLIHMSIFNPLLGCLIGFALYLWGSSCCEV